MAAEEESCCQLISGGLLLEDSGVASSKEPNPEARMEGKSVECVKNTATLPWIHCLASELAKHLPCLGV